MAKSDTTFKVGHSTNLGKGFRGRSRVTLPSFLPSEKVNQFREDTINAIWEGVRKNNIALIKEAAALLFCKGKPEGSDFSMHHDIRKIKTIDEIKKVIQEVNAMLLEGKINAESATAAINALKHLEDSFYKSNLEEEVAALKRQGTLS